jgi:hypothetical protein
MYVDHTSCDRSYATVVWGFDPKHGLFLEVYADGDDADATFALTAAEDDLSPLELSRRLAQLLPLSEFRKQWQHVQPEYLQSLGVKIPRGLKQTHLPWVADIARAF